MIKYKIRIGKLFVQLNTWSGTGVYFVKIHDAANNHLNTKKIILQQSLSLFSIKAKTTERIPWFLLLLSFEKLKR